MQIHTHIYSFWKCSFKQEQNYPKDFDKSSKNCHDYLSLSNNNKHVSFCILFELLGIDYIYPLYLHFFQIYWHKAIQFKNYTYIKTFKQKLVVQNNSCTLYMYSMYTPIYWLCTVCTITINNMVCTSICVCMS